MASERMRILIRKFELSSAAISSRCLAALGCPETLPDCSQSQFCSDPTVFFFLPPSVRLVRPECPGKLRSYGFFVPPLVRLHDPTDFFVSSPLCPPSLANSKKGLSDFLALPYVPKTTSKQYSVFSFSSVISKKQRLINKIMKKKNSPSKH